jgi:hypothetical protein
MKKTLHYFMTLSLIMMCSASIAQPTLLATSINPVVGESFTIFSTSSAISAGSPGAAQSWDLSSMSGTSSLISVVAPSSTANGASFPTSNVAWSQTAGVNYYKTSATALQSCGFFGSGVVFSYSDPEDYLHFPFTYNNTYTDTWATQFVSGGYTFYRTGTTTVTADGYGQVITPTSTYTGVLRVHYLQVYQDSFFVGAPTIISYTNDEYMWYKNGAHVQIATVYTLNSSSGGPYYGASYVGGGVGIDNLSDLITSSNLFPNPAVDNVTIDFTLTENKKVEINQSAGGLQGENSMQLDIANLPDGIYFAQIIFDSNVAATKRFVISK